MAVEQRGASSSPDGAHPAAGSSDAPGATGRTARGELAASIGLTAAPVTPADDSDPAEQVRAGLDHRLRVLVDRDPGTRSGEDPEDLHQMRVSVRRMRAMLKTARDFLDRGRSDPLRAELGWLGRSLGPVRDLDVQLGHLAEQVAALPEIDRAGGESLLRELRRRREREREAMLSALDSARYDHLLRRLVEYTSAPVGAAVPTGRTATTGAAEQLLRLTGRQYRKLRKAVRELPDEPSDEQLHDLRIRGKSLRYTAEFAEPLCGEPVRGVRKAAKALQDVLGEHQDACVALEQLRELGGQLGSRGDAPAGFTAGRLAEQENRRRLQRREQWPRTWQELRSAAGELS
ncbi:CHAD domain-containing protein [Salinifilum ghardaiensis]